MEGRHRAIGDAYIVDHQFVVVVVMSAAIVTAVMFRFQDQGSGVGGLPGGIEAGFNGVVARVAWKIEEEVGRLEFVGLEVETQETVGGGILPPDGEGRSPAFVSDCQLPLLLDLKFGASRDCDDPTGGFGEYNRPGRSGEGEGEERRNDCGRRRFPTGYRGYDIVLV